MVMVVMVELITGVTVLVKAPVIHCLKLQVLLLSFWLSKILIELLNLLCVSGVFNFENMNEFALSFRKGKFCPNDNVIVLKIINNQIR